MTEATCTSCNVTKPLADFEFRTKLGKHRRQCRTCMNQVKREHYHKNPLTYKLREAKRRAISRGMEFDLTIEDIVIPEYCPLLGMKMEVNTHGAAYNSPSLDRIDSTKGYTKDNVWVISHRANTVKSDASYEELFTLVYNLQRHLNRMGLNYEEVSSGHRDELNSQFDLVLCN